eukprot:5709444-Prymnesium_polylepis.1
MNSTAQASSVGDVGDVLGSAQNPSADTESEVWAIARQVSLSRGAATEQARQSFHIAFKAFKARLSLISSAGLGEAVAFVISFLPAHTPKER